MNVFRIILISPEEIEPQRFQSSQKRPWQAILETWKNKKTFSSISSVVDPKKIKEENEIHININ
jgi:hypothetical protein